MNKITGPIGLLLGTLGLTAFGSTGPAFALNLAERPWLTEQEFDADPSLYAETGQTLVLDLEGSVSGQGAIRRNSARLLVDSARTYSFCIPGDEPHIQRIKLSRTGGPTLINGAHGTACRPVLLEPGRYELEIFHNSRSVAAGGRKAFVYRRSPSALGGSLTGSLMPQFDFMAFGRSGKFVSSAAVASATAMQMAAVASDVGSDEVWRITPVSNSKWALTSGTGAGVLVCQDGNGALLTAGADDFCGSPYYVLRATFRFSYLAGSVFNIQEAVAQNGYVYNQPVYVSSDNYLFGGGGPTTFESAYQGYDCGTTCDDTTLPLSPGTIALYSECNFQGSAIVFGADAPDLSIYNAAGAKGLAMGSDQARSIRVAPGTVVTLYPDAQYGGNGLTVGANVACLDTTALGSDNLSSFRIIDQSPINYIISSNGCRDCVLTGIDFSSEDFDGFDFTGTSFSGGNLISTSFKRATLSGAYFSGTATQLASTDFTGALLACASFSSANVTSTIFTDIVLTSSASCRLDMEAATLDYATFPTQYWRNTDLTASNMTNLPDTLSTQAAPLELYGTNLSEVQWLAGQTLDYVNLGCYANDSDPGTVCPTPSGTMTCSILKGTTLTSASLRSACLKGANLQGALLDYANLDGADLEGAVLQAADTYSAAAVLTGAFMRDVNLKNANLTGVNANFANFFSSSSGSGTADATNATMTFANWTNAYLANADFSNAVLQATVWTSAVLVGASFNGADLSSDAVSRTNTKFTGAFLHGADFSNAVVTAADFTNSYWALDGSGGTEECPPVSAGGALVVLLQPGNIEFAGYWNQPPPPPFPSPLYTDECVEASYSSQSIPPASPTTSNICPNGQRGPCEDVWNCPNTSINLATPKTAAKWPPYPGTCTAIDPYWNYRID